MRTTIMTMTTITTTMTMNMTTTSISGRPTSMWLRMPPPLAIVALLSGKFFGLAWMDPVMGMAGAAVIMR